MDGAAPTRLAARFGIRSRRGRALPLNIGLWVLLWGVVVFALHAATASYGRRIGPYWSGIVSLVGFVAVAWYSVRKRNVWFSVRLLRTTNRLLPQAMQRWLVYLDRLETWRAFHVTVGLLVLVPLWWHIDTGLMSPLEAVLALSVALLIIIGVAGVYVQDYLPRAIASRAEHEVRLKDVDAKINSIYVEAEEKILGHDQLLVQAYLKEIKPLLIGSQPSSSLLWATIITTDPGPPACVGAERLLDKLGNEAPLYRELLDLAARKVNLEHNAFNLRLSTGWLQFHVGLAILTFALVVFHVLAVLYFAGA